jgi:hypothetical protein
VDQVDYRTERRSLRADGSGPLPQFDLAAWEASDPDRTLERLPRLSGNGSPIPPPVAQTMVSPTAYVSAPHITDDVQPGFIRAQDPELDMEATVEIVPEISATDILETAQARPARPPLPPLVLPERVSVPLDLDRLLARAHAEASRSPEFFRQPVAPAVTAPSFGDSVPFFAGVGQARGDFTPAVPISIEFERPRSRLGWLVATVLAAAVSTVAVVSIQSRVSLARSARSPESITITKAAPAFSEVAALTADRSDIPTMSAQALPRVESGTISLAAVAASHRLFVDGKVVESGSQVVSCGTHLAQVGSRGVRRYVNVPCGQEIVLAN